MLNTEFSPWPDFTEEEAKAVHDVIISNKVNYWTGSHCIEFEREFAEWVGVKYAVALTNGTVALDLALKTLGIGPGDEVIVTSRTFIASVSCIVTAGATPVFADVDRNSQNITAETIRKVVSTKTRAIICVHLAGWPCEMDDIMKLSDELGLYVIEDCAQAHGASYKGQSVGSIGHIGAWSFCQDKIMTTGGEGGMVTTNDKDLWLKMWSYKDHGKAWHSVYKKQHPPGFRWVHDSFGTNWRMMEVQGVIGRIQLKRMDAWTKKRQLNAKAIWDEAKLLESVRVPEIPEYINHAVYKCYFFLELSELKNCWDRERVIMKINELGVPCYSGACSEVYLEKAFDKTKYRPVERLKIAQELGSSSLMFLVHPTLTQDMIQRTRDVIREVLVTATR